MTFLPSKEARIAVQDLVRAREDVTMLRGLLMGGSAPPLLPEAAEKLMGNMSESISRALMALDPAVVQAAEAAAAAEKQPAGSPVSVGRKKKADAGAGDVTGGFRRRSESVQRKKRVTAKTLDDGHTWRKYGQKHIRNSTHPRSYYRCTHKPEQGCNATRQVQRSEKLSSLFNITYIGEHTCRDPSVIPYIIDASGSNDSGEFISFAAAANKYGCQDYAATRVLSSPPPFQSSQQTHDSNEEELSNLTPGSSPAEHFMASNNELAVLVGSSLITTRIPSSPGRFDVDHFIADSFPDEQYDFLINDDRLDIFGAFSDDIL